MNSKLFILEGPDSVGKTSIATALVSKLNSEGIAASYFSFPGRELGTLGWMVYRLHHDSSVDSITPTALQALHVAAHLDVIERKLNPLLDSGTNIVLDRYWWSTYVYGANDGVDTRILNRLIEAEKEMWSRLPDHVFLLDRANPINTIDSPSFHSHRELYDNLAFSEKSNYPVTKINNERSPLDALQEIWTKIARK